ncbi:magnesium-dependent phosphatase 1-like isoform X1 [Acropora millepora]|uniref:magnesium-dependent phosphatase 1-like isoform X1 n=1 Tax=Acropora millepora TaxID=45264 RepID=UPI001CF3D3CB|nr:magnesium-dependent phosphatase 1-like isoform X1 [Acropora millepora]XP_044175696.1 magnesium-dependent phosphatase 1-like isoform X1 [Acropora millepora]
MEEIAGKHLPQLIVFDLGDYGKQASSFELGSSSPRNLISFCLETDFTLWPFWVDTHVTAPFKRKSHGSVEDRRGYKIKLYDDSLAILEVLKSKGICMAAASRTDDPPAAKELLRALDIDQYFTYKEIYPGSKVSHFKKFTQASGISYADMLFFDDEERNIDDISRLGVTCVLVEQGMKHTVLENGLKKFASKHAR